MRNQPIVSVIIPTYNHARFLRKAIDSVRAQTLTNWEAIIVNNYSKDDTEDVVAACNDPRIQLENFRNHGVIAASRNYGVALAKGDYIAFLDSDDEWYPEKLERSMAALKNGNDVACNGERWVRDGVEFRQVRYGPAERASYHSLLFRGNCLSTSAVMVRKSFLEKVGGFSEDSAFVTTEDYELWLRLSKEGGSFVFVDEILGEYNVHKHNTSRSVLRQMRAELAVLDKHFSAWGKWSLTDRLYRLRRLARTYLAYGIRLGKEAMMPR